jgi:riboflavin synthase
MMFTGIIAAVGRIESAVPGPGGPNAGLKLSIACGSLALDTVSLGDSIAINGVCLTVTKKDSGRIEADVSGATLACTVGLDGPGAVNLEKALCLGDALGGHLVSGHVDGVGRVLQFESRGESFLLRILAPHELARFLAVKGSVTVQGVSLTINSVEDLAAGCAFAINLIPHTLSHTTLREITPGDRVNLEVDMMARYAERLARFATASPAIEAADS